MRDRVKRWSRFTFEFAVNQGLAQAAGMVSGLIYVRLMPVDQYALYALSLSTLAFVSVGSDLGLTGSLSYFWRESFKTGGAIEPKIAVVRRLRSLLLALAVLVAAAMFYKTAMRQSWRGAGVLACFLLVAGTAWSQINTSVELQLLRLKGYQRQSYYCEAAASFTRLLAACGMLVMGGAAATFALAGGLLGSLATFSGLAFFTGGRPGTTERIDSATWHEVKSYLLPILPGVLVYMIQDPLILWLAATYGGATPVSEAFAAGRIGAVFALIGQFVVVVVTPRLAAIGDDAHFVRMAAGVGTTLVGLGAMATVLAYAMPWLPLMLIGPKYAHLASEVVIVTASASVGVLTSFVVVANRLRGWVLLDPVIATLQLASIVALALSWTFDSALQVLSLGLLMSLFSLAGAVAVTLCGVCRPELVRARR